MKLEINSNSISIGEGNTYLLPDLNSWKVWKSDSGKVVAKVQPKHGKPEMYEVEFAASFKGMDGTPVPNPEYFIISWLAGMPKPECMVKSGDKHMAAEFYMSSKPEDKPKRKGWKVIPGLHEGVEDDEGNPV